MDYGKNQPHSLHQKNVMQVYQFVNFTVVKKKWWQFSYFPFSNLAIELKYIFPQHIF